MSSNQPPELAWSVSWISESLERIADALESSQKGEIKRLKDKLNRHGCICLTSIDPDCHTHKEVKSDEQ